LTFLNPSVLIGLIAGLIPIALHFINMRKLKRVDFSTLYFMKELRKTKIRKLKFKQWLLLLLRLLIIISLVIAFAKPALNSGIPLGGERAKKTAIFILDDSPSMSVLTGNGTLFNQAKKTISDLLYNYTDDDILFFLRTSEINANSVSPTNKASLIKSIKNLALTSVSCNLSKTLNLAIKKISAISTLKKDVFILSDFNRNTFSRKEFIKSAEGLNKNSLVYLIPFKGDLTGNLSLKSFSLTNHLISVETPVNFTASIQNSSLRNSLTGTISLFINKNRVAQKSLTVESTKNISLNLSGTLTTSGFIESKASLSDDQLAFDNERYFSFYVKAIRKVLVTAPKKSDADFLITALTADQKLHSEISFQNISTLSSEDLNKYDALFIIGVPVSNTAKIKSFIKKGGGVVWFPSSDFNERKFLKALHTLTSAQYYGLSSTESMPPLQFEKINFSHPLFEGLFERKQKNGINSPEIKEHLRIKSNGKGRAVITLEDRSEFLSEYSLGKGVLFLFNVPPNLQWSNFPIKPVFAPLVNRLLIFITSGQSRNLNIIAGSEFKISARFFTSPTIKVVTPNGNEQIINSNELKGKKFYSFKKTYYSGFYNIFSNGKKIESFAVNVSPTELDFTNYTNEELRKFKFVLEGKNKFKVISPKDDIISNLKTSSTGQEFWKLFLALALIFAILEILVARVSKKEILEFEGK